MTIERHLAPKLAKGAFEAALIYPLLKSFLMAESRGVDGSRIFLRTSRYLIDRLDEFTLDEAATLLGMFAEMNLESSRTLYEEFATHLLGHEFEAALSTEAYTQLLFSYLQCP